MNGPETPYTLRPASAADAESIATLHAESWRRTYRGMMTDEFLDGGALADRRSVWRERLTGSHPKQFVCVAETAGRIVGFICTFASEDPVWGAYIDNLHVVHDMHRRGVGRALMQRAAHWLCELESQGGVYLWVMEGNATARRFYERMGARNAETIVKEDPGGGHASNCRYVWVAPQVLVGE